MCGLCCEWLSSHFQQQVEAGVNTAEWVLNTSKSALVPLFCGWLASTVQHFKGLPRATLSKCFRLDRYAQKYSTHGLLVAWEFDSEEYKSLLQEASTLATSGKLWDSNDLVPKVNSKEISHNIIDAVANVEAVGAEAAAEEEVDGGGVFESLIVLAEGIKL